MLNKKAKPFLKWAGGKTQLIHEIENTLPLEVVSKNFTYIEPFVGSGAILFWMINNFPQLKKAVINEVSEGLINVYKVIASNPKELKCFKIKYAPLSIIKYSSSKFYI